MDRARAAELLGPAFEAISSDAKAALCELGLAPDAAILDVGTGAGNFATFMALSGYEVLTGEPESDASRYAGHDWETNAKRLGVRDRIRFQSFDASDMPFASDSFDGVFFFGVLHHIDEALRPAVLREALRVSKENGAVVFFEPKTETLRKVWESDPDHPLAANPSDYVGDLAVAARDVAGSITDIYILRKAAPFDRTSGVGA